MSINQRLLSKQLRELEEVGLVIRHVYSVVPLKVDYSLSDEVKELQHLIMELSLWGRKWLERRGMKTAVDEDLDVLKEVFAKTDVLDEHCK
ncbi:winged helix-turn-helix transcriptional regulator [Acinetobacter nosocomialis]|uniref:winged helix-turn-helix transcriptional regulator n=1 Tax=Acinetobacter nosocomialis TaxID=106654 RepID=UPI00341619A4